MSLLPRFARWMRGLGRGQQGPSKHPSRKRRRGHLPAFERIEPRMMLHGGGLEAHAHDQFEDHATEGDGHGLEYYDQSVGAWLHAQEVGPLELGTGNSGGDPVGASGTKNPLSALPNLNSLPGANVSVYLDFNGHFESGWGSYGNINTPVYDTDGDYSTFSDTELAAITEIWQRVSEDFAPFKVNVTTVDPGNFANGKALRVVIGGNGSWLGSGYGGVAYVDGFTNSAPNTVFVFSENLGKSLGGRKSVADAASHESGHGFGLQHQSKYSGSTKLAEYNPGTSALAPLMGKSYSAERSTWWYGSSTSSGTMQDDMAVIARSANGFGYRADDHGSKKSTNSELAVNGSSLSASGIIGTNSDKDFLRFSTSGGPVTLSVEVAVGANLDAKLKLFTGQYVKLAGANPSNSLSASITMELAAGDYVMGVIGKKGGYGSVGQYTITGTAPQDPLGAPAFAGGSTPDSGGLFSGLASWGSWGLAASAGNQPTTAWALPQVNEVAVASSTSLSRDTLGTAFQPLPAAPFAQTGHDALDSRRESPVWMEYELQGVGRPRTRSSALSDVPGEFGQDATSEQSGDLIDAKQNLFSHLSADALAQLLTVG